MSRRTFLESMRQEARCRGGYDSGGSACSSADLREARRVEAAAAFEGPNPHEDLVDVAERPEHHLVAAAVGSEHAAPLLLRTSAPIGPPSGALDSDYGEALATWEFGKQGHHDNAAEISTALDPSRVFSALPQDPLAVLHNDTQREGQRSYLRQGNGDAASSSSSSRGGSSGCSPTNLRYLDGGHVVHDRRAHPPSSQDTVLKCGQDRAPFSRHSSPTTAATASAVRRRSATDRVRRTSGSGSSITDLYGHAESNASVPRRFSLGRPGSAQRCQYRDATSPLAVCRSGSQQDRCNSMNRVEASLVALQVELAAEKRNNIEAENHITTLNREVKRLREENARLSREVAVAATAVHTACAPPDSAAPGGGALRAGATSSSSTAPANLDAAAAEKRIEVLEARLGELSRDMETKQRELDMKDERIRLLEHKLADRLLLHSGMSYMEVIPRSPPEPLQQTVLVEDNSATAQPKEKQRRPSRTRQKATERMSSASAHGTSSRLYWQAQAPDTTLAGPRVSTIRSVSGHNMPISHSINDDSAGLRAVSLERVRSTCNHRRQSDEAGGWEEKALTDAEVQPSVVSLRASQHDVKASRPLSATRELRPKSPVAPSARRRPSSTSSQPGISNFSARTRPTTRTDGSARRRYSRDTFASGGQMDSDAASRAASDTESAHRPHRFGSTNASRRPSMQRRKSTSLLRSARTSVCEDSQRASSRRNSAASPVRRPSRTMATGRHSICLSVGDIAVGDPRLRSPGGPAYGRAKSIFLSNGPTGRCGSATCSETQQSALSGTSTRSRPQITYSADNESAVIKGSTTTVVFRSSNSMRAGMSSSYGGHSYARHGAPLLPSRLSPSAKVLASDEETTPAAVDL
ncbi:hypothetical protein, conserved [Leishmania tarentolae]|uniref:Uncharacterized protein n=1 Tax=Leishmania tarentolae TaxID=5689 RepID=A0A640KIU3_LEITA|nr:hypothetical protein, conserved [Leishmania tarentolae]